MPLRTASTARLSSTVVEQFEGLIESGEWPVGSRIPPEQHLVEQLGVGRSTVREAVRALEHAGLLEPRRGDGTYVRAQHGLSAALMRRTKVANAVEVLEVRDSIERHAARAAATRRTRADLEQITTALAERHAARERGDEEAFLAADKEFHTAIIAATHNSVLLELWEGLGHSPHREHGTDHDTLAAAIVDGDQERAEQAVLTHDQGRKRRTTRRTR
jgi:DNA-binding FadR family transcriptional regulator